MIRRRVAEFGIGLLVAAVLAGGLGCAGRKTRGLEGMDVRPRKNYERALAFLAAGKQFKAKTVLERIEFAAEDEDRAELEPLVRLAIADVTFYQSGDLALIDARNLYLDFVTLYGEHRLAPYAQIQAGLCSIKSMRHPSRDQAQTHQALADLSVVLRRWPSSAWAGAAESLMVQARANIAESEFLVGEFYLDRKQYDAAADRFRGLLETFPEYTERPKVLWRLARALIRSQQTDAARTTLYTIVAQHPQDPLADEARRALAELASAAPVPGETPN